MNRFLKVPASSLMWLLNVFGSSPSTEPAEERRGGAQDKPCRQTDRQGEQVPEGSRKFFKVSECFCKFHPQPSQQRRGEE
jgi:hypothetical protein